MSYTSNYNLNQRISYLESIIQQIVPSLPLALDNILANGNSAGTFDIDLNNNDLLQVNNINLSTINGGAYPPVVSADTLSAVLTAGNTANNSIILTDGVNTTTINNTSITSTTFNGALNGNASTATTATNATNTAITTSSTNASFYPTFVSATTGDLPQLVDTNLTYNPSTNVMSFTALPECSAVPTTGDQLVNKTYVDSEFGNLHFYDEMWAEGASVNGLLGMRLAGTGAGSSSMASAEPNHYGIVRVATPSSNTNTTWTMNSPLIWSNVDYIEVVFRGWAVGTSTNTTCSVGLMNNVNALDTTAICLMYSTNISPTNTWQLRVNSASAYSFNGVNFPQLANTWLKIRLTNAKDTGNWEATLTRLDTNVSESASGTGVDTGTEFFVGGGVSCVSGGVSKRVDFDSIELQIK